MPSFPGDVDQSFTYSLQPVTTPKVETEITNLPESLGESCDSFRVAILPFYFLLLRTCMYGQKAPSSVLCLQNATENEAQNKQTNNSPCSVPLVLKQNLLGFLKFAIKRIMSDSFFFFIFTHRWFLCFSKHSDDVSFPRRQSL